MIVKVCGVRTAEVADAAVDAGADWIGVVLDPRSPRYADASAVAEVQGAVDGAVEVVGVMVDPTITDCEKAVKELGVDMLQVHGKADRQLAAECDVPVIRAINPAGAHGAYTTDWWPDGWLLLDASIDDEGVAGGTGRTVDGVVAAEMARHRRVILAGGLGPDNVAEAIKTVRPHGVDASSGLESAPGVKDVAKVRAFVDAARGAS